MSFKRFFVFAMMMIFASAITITNYDGKQAWYTFDEGPKKSKCINSF